MKHLHRTAVVSLNLALLVGASACGDQAQGTSTSASTTAASTTASTQASGSAAAPASASVRAEAPKGDIFFVQPTAGATVFGEVDFAIDVKALKLAAAGTKEAGYAVVIIDGAPVADGTKVPTDDKHIALAKGEKFGTATLAEGKHKLTVQYVDANGMGWGTKLAQTIEVTVLPDEGKRSVSFLNLKDGAKVKSPLAIKFGVEGMKVVPAGKDATARTSGHHHVLIGHDAVPVGQVIPSNETNKHFGKGQTETTLELAKGRHKLTMQFADGSHSSYGEKMSATITVEVE